MKLKKILKTGIMGLSNAMALFMVLQTANSACVWVIHQPEFPKEAEKFKKI